MSSQYGSGVSEGWLQIPVSEFENLHEESRLLRVRIGQLIGLLEERGEEIERLRAEVTDLQARLENVTRLWHESTGGGPAPKA